jgi:LmbE family N-acetylglucosaminyl deacetylase
LRRQEDRAALQVLSAAPLWLDFYDSQYHATPSLAELTDAFESIVGTHDAATVLFPAGLFHSDHVLVHNAMLNVRKHHPGKNWLMYEEASYRRIPGLLQRRMADLLREDIEATPVVFGIDNHNDSRDDSRTARKRAAVACYASQLRALERTVNDGYADVFAPERYWRLDGISAGAQEA